MFDARLAIAAVFVAVLAAIPSAMAQKSAAQIVLTEGDAPTAHTVLGEVRAEAHQKALFSKVSVREVADQQLRDQAAKMGADAVIGIKYEPYNPMTSKKGFRAVGRAVKFTTTFAAAAPAPATSATAIAIPQPATPAVVIAAPPVQVAAAAPAVVGMVALSEQDIPGRAYQVVGEISSEVHQTSMFPKKSSRELLDEDLRAKAARLGADAVIQIKYTTSNPMFSKKGSTAAGKAVKFIPLQPLVVPTPVVQAPAPAPVIEAPVAVAAAPPPPTVPSAPIPSVVPTGAPTAAAAPAAAPGILLSEQNLSRSYDVLGPVNAELNQALISLDKTGRQVLDETLRRQAADLGADAVILIRYAGPAGAKGATAIGVAVKFR